MGRNESNFTGYRVIGRSEKQAPDYLFARDKGLLQCRGIWGFQITGSPDGWVAR
jgi:hypothetical protein